MNSNSNSKNSGGLFSALTGAVSAATSAVTNAVKGTVKNSTNNTKKNTTNNTKKTNMNTTVKPVTAEVNAPTVNENSMSNSTAPMKGGAASVNSSIPYGQRQPTEAVMQWATTAGAPTPTGSQMRNVAHGGKRRTRKRRTHRRRHTKHKKSHRQHKRTTKRHTHRK